MKVILQKETIGNEILKAVAKKREEKAADFNKKQAEKYLKYCLSTGDETLIQYAKSKL